MDSHNSHMNMRFIDYCDQNRILFAILPPHSTHRLQPLDIDLFGPLAEYYNQEIDRFIANSQNFVSIFKRHFWNFFCKVYTRAFTQQNIRTDWTIIGIYSLNPKYVLVRILKRKKKSEITSSSKISGSDRAFRGTFDRLQIEDHINREAAILTRGGEKLAAENKILRRKFEGLREAIFEKKC
jgi:hypothetical protein